MPHDEQFTPELHRKRVKRYECASHARSLTFSTYKRLPLLEDESHIKIVLEAIGRACEGHCWSALAFVVMPEHVHLLVMPRHDEPEEQPAISRLLWAIKRPSSYRLKQRFMATQSPLLNMLTIHERPGKTAFRFWQEGGGFDRNITSPEILSRTVDYIHANPVRRGLANRPEDYPWSSARQSRFPEEQIPEWMPRIERDIAL